VDFGLWISDSSFSFELGMKEFQGIKDANALFVPQMKPLRPLIPFDSFIPNSNEKLLDFGLWNAELIDNQHIRHSEIRNPQSEIPLFF
jgi:hypothetical protein